MIDRDEVPAALSIRVLLADDHRLFREGVASLLERTGDITLVGEAANGEEVVRLTGVLHPDIVLMDLQMPGMGGVAATRAIVAQQPGLGIIMLTMFDDDESIYAALRAGARGYVLKDASRGLLLQAIRAVAQGEALLGPTIARRMLEQFRQAPAAVAPEPAVSASLASLTPRESEVLGLIARGLRNREIAEQLFVSERTVGNHISSIFAKLHVTDRSQVIVHALRGGLGHGIARDGPNQGSADE